MLVVGEITEIVLEDAKKTFMAAQTDALNQMEALLVGAEASAKKVSTDIVNKGAEWLDQKFRETGDQLLERITARFSAQIEQANDAAKQVRLFSYMTFFCTF